MDPAGFITLAYAAVSGCLAALVQVGAQAAYRKTPPGQTRPLSLAIIVPAFNESNHLGSISSTLALAAALRVPAVVVDDGSRDGSTTHLAEICSRRGALLIRHDMNLGKAAALNTGIAAVSAAVVVTVDADTSLDAASLIAAAMRFEDPGIGAVALELVAHTDRWLGACQRTEYQRVLGLVRVGLYYFSQVFTVPGAAACWRRDAILSVNGFSARTMAEDTDATMALRRAGWKIALSTGTAATIVPSTLRQLLRQRVRWTWGLVQAATWHFADSLRPNAKGRGAAWLFAAFAAFQTSGWLMIGILGAAVVFRQSDGLLFCVAIVAIVSCARIVATQWMCERSFVGLPMVLVQLSVMRGIDVTAFWLGLATGAAVRRRW